MASLDTISFLSDYGNKDEFVGVVKSVIRTIAPGIGVVDLTHEIARHDIRGGALALTRSVQYLCPGVVLAVVDPGVGSDRRAIAVEVGDEREKAYFVGPDNGLLASAVMMVGGATRAVEIDNPEIIMESPGPLFAGRDIFAPAAAFLCLGKDLKDIGTEIDPVTLQPGLVPLPRFENGKIYCEVLWVDNFGNIQLNLGADDLKGDEVLLKVRDEVRNLKVRKSYADFKPTEVGIVIDSYGMVAIAMFKDSASEVLKIGEGDGLTLEFPS